MDLVQQSAGSHVPDQNPATISGADQPIFSAETQASDNSHVTAAASASSSSSTFTAASSLRGCHCGRGCQEMFENAIWESPYCDVGVCPSADDPPLVGGETVDFCRVNQIQKICPDACFAVPNHHRSVRRTGNDHKAMTTSRGGIVMVAISAQTNHITTVAPRSTAITTISTIIITPSSIATTTTRTSSINNQVVIDDNPQAVDCLQVSAQNMEDVSRKGVSHNQTSVPRPSDEESFGGGVFIH